MATPYVSQLGTYTAANASNASFTITLPSTTSFAHLWITGWLKGATGGSTYMETLRMSLNSDTNANNYSGINYYQTTTSSSTSPSTSATTNYNISYIYGNAGNSYILSPVWIWIPNYRSSTYKTAISSSSMANNDAGLNYGRVGLGMMEWRSTAAITTLTFSFASGGNFDTYSTINVYGVKDN